MDEGRNAPQTPHPKDTKSPSPRRERGWGEAIPYQITTPAHLGQGTPAAVGGSTLIGAIGQVVSTLEPAGTIRVQGTIWRARAAGVIASGEWVKVTDRSGLELQVVQVDRDSVPAEVKLR